MAATYDDPVKQKSREKLRDFIKKNLRKRPSDIRVVCFPGAEVEGEEAIEVKEVYDPLGIPRENVVGLEHDAERAERLRKADLGIRVVHAPDLEFFSSTAEVFDVISLDYTGHQDEDEIRTLEEIAGRQLLYPRGILATNYAAKRESKGIQKRTFQRFAKDILYGCIPVKGAPQKEWEKVNLVWQIIAGKSDFTLADARNSITTEIIRALKGGVFSLDRKKAADLFRANPEYRRINEGIRQRIRESIQKEPEIIEEVHCLVEVGALPPDWVERTINGSPDQLDGQYMTVHCEAFGKMLSARFGLSYETGQNLAGFLHHERAKCYFVGAMERYSYNSNKNMMMHMDIVLFDQHRRFFQRGEDIIHAYYDRVPPDIMFDRLGLRTANPRKFCRKLDKMENTYCDLFTAEIPKRTYLGSSYHRKPGEPEPEKEAISKEGAVMLLRDGCSPKELFECFSGFTEHQLRAYKAHYVTMGKKLMPTGS